MILVDVQFPELNRTIDFQLDETAIGWVAAEEIASMAAQTNGRSFSPTENGVVLYSIDKGCRVDLNRSLQANGIQAGERLLLI